MDEVDAGIGRRVREIRTWRRLSVTAAAELAGMSPGYLSRIERGLRPVQRRATVEALASALRVSPGELTGAGRLIMSQSQGDQHTATVALRNALSDNTLDDPVSAPHRSWAQIATDLGRLNRQLRPSADYMSIGELLPGLLDDLFGVVATDPDHATAALRGLLDCYGAATYAGKYLGAPDLASVAAIQARTVAARLDSPAHFAFADLLRAQAVGQPSRARALDLASHAADRVQPAIGSDGRAAEMYGMLRLTCALGSAALSRFDESREHEAAAAEMAARVGSGSNFGNQNFSTTNLGFWGVTLAVERGEGGRVAELARNVDPTGVSSNNRRAGFFTDVGRGLSTEKGHEETAVAALRQAEELAPQRVRANPYVRDAVTDLLRRARREAGGRELRGLAYRVGVAG